MKAATNMNGELCKKLLKLIPVLAIMRMCIPSAQAVEVLYTFDDPSDTTTSVFDQRTADGSQNGASVYGNSWTLSTNVENQSAAGLWPDADGHLGILESPTINYSSGMTWSTLVKPTSASSSGYSVLFWAGWLRGAGETYLAFDPTGHLVWYEAGIGALTTTASVFQTNRWQAVGITFDNAVGGGTLTFYTNGAPMQAFSGLGSIVNGGNAGGSETVFGFMWNVGGQDGTQYRGYVDNIYMANRALSASEMELIQVIPEPASVALAGLGVLVLLRRRRKS